MDQRGEAFNHRTVDAAEFEKVRTELQAQADNVRRLERQVIVLRAMSGVSQVGAFGSSLLSNSLVVVVGCAVLPWWFSMDRSTVVATVAPSALAQTVSDPGPVAMPQLVVAGPPVRVNVPVRRDERSGSGYYAGPGYDYPRQVRSLPVGQCWRDRSIRGGCFSEE